MQCSDCLIGYPRPHVAPWTTILLSLWLEILGSLLPRVAHTNTAQMDISSDFCSGFGDISEFIYKFFGLLILAILSFLKIPLELKEVNLTIDSSIITSIVFWAK